MERTDRYIQEPDRCIEVASQVSIFAMFRDHIGIVRSHIGLLKGLHRHTECQMQLVLTPVWSEKYLSEKRKGILFSYIALFRSVSENRTYVN